jgi:hypothetical protein
VGFSQFGQDLTSNRSILGYNFTQLTDSPTGFSFWFRLKPYNSNGIAAFEVRVFGAEDSAELDYVFDPEPSLASGYVNSTSTHSLLFYGYQPGQWYHFSRDLKADWMTPMGGTPGLSLRYNFTLLQFEGFATNSSRTLKSETVWLDDVRAYVGTAPLPPESNWISVDFTDSNGNGVDSLIQSKLINWAGQSVVYSPPQSTLPTGPYYLQAYYRAYQPQYLILNQQIHLNTTLPIRLPMFPNPSIQGGYAILNDSIASATISQPTSSTLQILVEGTQTTSYAMLLDDRGRPTLVQANGSNLQQGFDWTYDSTLSIARVEFTTPTTGEENITVFSAPIITTLAITVLLTSVAQGTTPLSAYETATLSGGTSPTGDMIFNGFSNSGCVGPPLFAETVPVAGNGDYTSRSFTPTAAGAYYWTASYSGDSYNSPVTAPCGNSFTVFALPTLSFVDTAGSQLDNRITFRILDSQGNTVPYAPRRIVPAATYHLEAYYMGYRIYRDSLATSYNGAISLQMFPLTASTTSYIALNSTTASLSLQASSAKISFTLVGQGPFLIILNVPSKPLYIEKDGQQIESWAYNETSQTVAMETANQGSFEIVLQEPSSPLYLYAGTGIAAAALASVIIIVTWRKRKQTISTKRAEIETGL